MPGTAGPPTNYARTLLILALAAAGLADLDQAVITRSVGLDSSPHRVADDGTGLRARPRFSPAAPRAASAANFQVQYLGAGTRLALQAPRPQPGRPQMTADDLTPSGPLR
jgi:hypothetical protein